jgi:hypothetical protein
MSYKKLASNIYKEQSQISTHFSISFYEEEIQQNVQRNCCESGKDQKKQSVNAPRFSKEGDVSSSPKTLRH